MTFENWEALEDVYEEMLDEELELTKLKKANARKRDLELTLTDEDGEKLRSEGAPTKKRKKERKEKRVSHLFFRRVVRRPSKQHDSLINACVLHVSR